MSYLTLVVWEHELKDEKKLLERLKCDLVLS
jgi:hypothetical protein